MAFNANNNEGWVSVCGALRPLEIEGFACYCCNRLETISAVPHSSVDKVLGMTGSTALAAKEFMCHVLRSQKREGGGQFPSKLLQVVGCCI